LVPAYRHVRDRCLVAQLQLFAKAREYSGASGDLDVTKSMRRTQLFARDGRCQMKVLHLVRDGRAFCTSYLKNTHPVPTWTDAAEAWVSYVEQVDQFSRAFPSIPVLLVRYEDLCRSTPEVLRTVCRFLEISYEEPPADMMKDAHILGNRMRRTFSGAIVENTSWREKLDNSTQMELTSLMKPQLQQFGYL
ncbi:MAG: sulfotransferase, partial [Steroidobacterales bacterium]